MSLNQLNAALQMYEGRITASQSPEQILHDLQVAIFIHGVKAGMQFGQTIETGNEIRWEDIMDLNGELNYSIFLARSRMGLEG